MNTTFPLKNRVSVRLSIAAVVMLGCAQLEPPDGSRVCSSASVGSVLSAQLLSVTQIGERTQRRTDRFNDTVLVEGSASHTENMAIRSLEVAGIPAIQTAFNYERWQATLPFETLQKLPRSAADPLRAEVEITATDACERRAIVGRFEVAVDDQLGVILNDLNLVITPPGETLVVPENGRFPALVQVVGNPESVGAEISLQASSGRFDIEGVSATTVLLAGDGSANATATTFYYGQRSGLAQITASGQDLVKAITLEVAGVPVVQPASLTLPAGAETIVSVESVLELQCQSSPALGVEVTDGTDVQDLMRGAATIEPGDVIRIRVDPLLDEQRNFTIECTDPFGQTSQGNYTAEP